MLRLDDYAYEVNITFDTDGGDYDFLLLPKGFRSDDENVYDYTFKRTFYTLDGLKEWVRFAVPSLIENFQCPENKDWLRGDVKHLLDKFYKAAIKGETFYGTMDGNYTGTEISISRREPRRLSIDMTQEMFYDCLRYRIDVHALIEKEIERLKNNEIN